MKRSGPPKRRTPLRSTGGPARSGPPVRKTRLRRVSAKTAARDRVYRAEKAAYQVEHPTCEFVVDEETGERCGRVDIQCHHVESRGVAPDRVTDRSNFVSLCPPHHDFVSVNRADGERTGLIERSSYERRRNEGDAP